ncbi:hypothetical protein GW17_00023189 [Ensete ventricosum]|nr:hypothetical protein GW17_00023189 [Ensete ventricosum]
MQVLPTAPSPTVTHFINLDALISSADLLHPYPPQHRTQGKEKGKKKKAPHSLLGLQLGRRLLLQLRIGDKRPAAKSKTSAIDDTEKAKQKGAAALTLIGRGSRSAKEITFSFAFSPKGKEETAGKSCKSE